MFCFCSFLFHSQGLFFIVNAAIYSRFPCLQGCMETMCVCVCHLALVWGRFAETTLHNTQSQCHTLYIVSSLDHRQQKSKVYRQMNSENIVQYHLRLKKNPTCLSPHNNFFIWCHSHFKLTFRIIPQCGGTCASRATQVKSHLSSGLKRFHLLNPSAYDLKWQNNLLADPVRSEFHAEENNERQPAVSLKAGCVMCSLWGGNRCYLPCACSYSVFLILSLSSRWTPLTAGERWPNC